MERPTWVEPDAAECSRIIYKYEKKKQMTPSGLDMVAFKAT